MALEYNPVEVELILSGQPCYVRELTLTQKFNHHHRFRAMIEYEELESVWMDDPSGIFSQVGETATINMSHRDGKGVNVFEGIITNVEYAGRHGEKNYILLYGASPTIRLDGYKTMDSFMDKTLTAIVSESVGNSGNGGSVTPSPVHSGMIDYISQYDETCFEFLNRLSWIYGEWFYYDGCDCYFGNPNKSETDNVIYDIEMDSMKFSANLVPSQVNRYHYLVHEDKEVDELSDFPGFPPYLQVAADKSASIYTSEADLPVEPVPANTSELEKLVEAEKIRNAGKMLTLKGKTRTSKIKIGKKINFSLPDTMRASNKEIGNFLITEVIHHYHQNGTYSNSFKAIPVNIVNIPMHQIKEPKAFPQIATVYSNADKDGRGRVKVQFQWQKAQGKTTNWIRVQTPEAGKSDLVSHNRGRVYIPEEKDIVMIDFEYGDPNRPYVSGSIFSELVSLGGKDLNRFKSVVTRKNTKILHDDERNGGSLTFWDGEGNKLTSMIDMDGNGNVMITAPKSFTVCVGSEENAVFKMNDAGELFLYGKTMVELCVGPHMYKLTGLEPGKKPDDWESDKQLEYNVDVEQESDFNKYKTGSNYLNMSPHDTRLSTPSMIRSDSTQQYHEATQKIGITQGGEPGNIEIKGDEVIIN